ncbi:3beta-hydroxysteroid-dehydrogenase/decarboxylase, partial [Andrographis paniculata]|uniref:3beta-hydroxysteroid- dehydrogenase/decarboxylase n=1 Tax=Andrographis paniculata TaxID=175694 RepID=UPI0021E741E4
FLDPTALDHSPLSLSLYCLFSSPPIHTLFPSSPPSSLITARSLDMATVNGAADFNTCAVLGARGFVGRVLVERLLTRGNWIVRLADSHNSPDLKPSETLLADALASGRASYFQVDVRRESEIAEAIQGVSAVFYTDYVDSLPSDFYSCYKIIVQGARNVVDVCRECKVNRLIYNSSADVVFDDIHDIYDGDESMPYSGRFWDMVTDLRTQAEALIISANDAGGLLTCALRPCNVFGSGDKQLLPLLVTMAKSKWAKYIIGSGNSMSDFTYVDNVAHALICAEESLSSVSVSGKAYFITNLEPMLFREFAFLLLESLGYHRPVISLPVWVVQYVLFFIKLPHVNSDSGELDLRASACKIATLGLRTRTFNCSAAQKNIQYTPIVSMEEALKLTAHAFSDLAIDSPIMRYKDFNKPSKVERLLGNGKVADILLWKDEKETFLCFFSLALLYQWFFLSGRTFISSVAYLLLLTVLMLCGHCILPFTGYGSRMPRLSSSCFEISEVNMRSFFFTMRCILNKLDCLSKSLAKGEDWSTFLKVSIFLYFCKWIVPHYLTTALGLALILSFTLCFVYEQYEDKIDEIAIIAFSIAKNASIFFISKLPIASRMVPIPSDSDATEE